MPPASLPVLLRTAGLLALSNVFMTFAWYAQLKELSHKPWIVAALVVFVPFVLFYMKQPLKWDYLWAGLCILGAVYFIFRDGMRNVNT